MKFHLNNDNINKKKSQRAFAKVVPSPPQAGRGWGAAYSMAKRDLDAALHIGVIGAGGFASFAVKAFLQIPGVKIITVTDINKEFAAQMAKENNAIAYDDLE